MTYDIWYRHTNIARNQRKVGSYRTREDKISPHKIDEEAREGDDV